MPRNVVCAGHDVSGGGAWLPEATLCALALRPRGRAVQGGMYGDPEQTEYGGQMFGDE